MYDFKVQRKFINTDAGAKMLVRIVKKIESFRGREFRPTEAWAALGSYAAWDAMACIDFLVEMGYMRLIREAGAYQHNVYRVG